MKTVIIATFLLIAQITLLPLAQATVLTFDDITNIGWSEINNGYGGLNWYQFGVLPNTFWPSSGYENGTVSGEYVAFNNIEASGFQDHYVRVSGPKFDFNGAYLTSAWRHDLNLQIRGYLDGSLLYDTTKTLDIIKPTWFDFNFSGIDQLEFLAWGGTEAGIIQNGGPFFAMDNFTFNEPIPTPEPSTVLLLGSGLVGIICLKRKNSLTN